MKAIRILTIETVLMEKPCIFGHPDMNLFLRNRGIADLYLLTSCCQAAVPMQHHAINRGLPQGFATGHNHFNKFDKG